MFETHFGLQRTPFSREIPAAALFMARGHREALSRLLFVAERRNTMLLTGEPGVGKSTVIRKLQAELDPARYEVVVLNLIGSTPRSFYGDLLTLLRVEAPYEMSKARRTAAQALLERYKTQQRIPVLLLDEAQEMPDALLAELCGLLSYDCDSFTPFALVLSGNPRLANRLSLKHHEALAGRIRLQAHLEAFEQEESMAYVQHHLQVAGATRPIFTDEALKKLHQSTGGNPRTLNNIATLALMTAAGNKTDLIDDRLVADVVAAEWVRGGVS